MSPSLQHCGTFTIGCNYWASHAGTSMWRDWREDVVNADFELLGRHGFRVLRIFPLWPDFQPIVSLRGYAGRSIEFRRGPEEIPLRRERHASLDPTMLQRLVRVGELAQKHELHLIVGLITGWMSGRLFMPSALEGRNPLTDPVALAWERRLIGGIVETCRALPAIYAWDLGNECNCMGSVATAEEAFHWTASMSDAIRATDPTRPIISGMHCLSPQSESVWRIADQGQLTDLVTTHPYPYWISHGRLEPLDSYRSTLIPTIENCLYGDVAEKPSFVEELGSMGPMIAADEIAANWARANLLSLWAHDGRAFLWWCAFDQIELAHAPYDWVGVEPELGLFTNERLPKPFTREMDAFARWLKELPFDALPPRRLDGVCILSRNQDSWAVAIGAFCLAKQAGLEIAFRFADQEIPDVNLLIVPCLSGPDPLRRHEWRLIVERARAGATVLVSLNDGVVPEFNSAAGLRVDRRNPRFHPTRLTWCQGMARGFDIVRGDDLRCTPAGAEVLAHGSENEPLVLRHAIGAGWLITACFPLELDAALTPNALNPTNSKDRVAVYAGATAHVARARQFACAHPALSVTEHPFGDGRTVVVIINLSSTAVSAACAGVESSRVQVIRGHLGIEKATVSVPAHDGVVFIVAPARTESSPRPT